MVSSQYFVTFQQIQVSNANSHLHQQERQVSDQGPNHARYVDVSFYKLLFCEILCDLTLVFCIDLIMGIVAGTLFWQQQDDPTSVMGILFQSMFFVSIGAMLKIPSQFEPRSIFYKQQDANFYPTWAFVAGRSLAGFPTSLIDGVVYGSIVYWFVGLSSSDGVSSYFKFMLLVIGASMTVGLVFSIFSATVKDKSTAQACMSVCIVVLVLFSGFTVQPDVIPRCV